MKTSGSSYLKQIETLAIESVLRQKSLKTFTAQELKNYYEYGLVESMDPDDFNVKFRGPLKERWESLCPEFFNWFNRNRKSLS